MFYILLQSAELAIGRTNAWRKTEEHHMYLRCFRELRRVEESFMLRHGRGVRDETQGRELPTNMAFPCLSVSSNSSCKPS